MRRGSGSGQQTPTAAWKSIMPFRSFEKPDTPLSCNSELDGRADWYIRRTDGNRRGGRGGFFNLTFMRDRAVSGTGFLGWFYGCFFFCFFLIKNIVSLFVHLQTHILWWSLQYVKVKKVGEESGGTDTEVSRVTKPSGETWKEIMGVYV